jgi:hypothetical protein
VAEAAAERLAAVSLLAGWIEHCERVDVATEDTN